MPRHKATRPHSLEPATQKHIRANRHRFAVQRTAIRIFEMTPRASKLTADMRAAQIHALCHLEAIPQMHGPITSKAMQIDRCGLTPRQIKRGNRRIPKLHRPAKPTRIQFYGLFQGTSDKVQIAIDPSAINVRASLVKLHAFDLTQQQGT